MQSKVSIIVPVYGVEKYIERCSRSLFEQTYENIEYIFVDDCSEDNSINILKMVMQEYPTRQDSVYIISHECNKGLAIARNTGVGVSSGDYLLHVDSDDWLELNTIELLIGSINNVDADIICFGYFSEYRDRTQASKIINNKQTAIHNILTNKQHASIWSKMYKSDFYKNTGFAAIEGLNQGEDYVLVPRLLHRAKNIIYIKEHLYHYEMTNQSSYTKNVDYSAIKNIRDADDILYNYFSNVSDSYIYTETLEILYTRSMLYLLKTSNWNNYKDILSVYKNYSRNYTSLSIGDKFIIFLVNKGFYKLTSCFIKLGIKILK